MPIFCNNIYKTLYNGTESGVIRKISFQATNRKIYLTMFYHRYGSTGPKKSIWVLKGVKMPIFYNNDYKTPYNGTNPGLRLFHPPEFVDVRTLIISRGFE